MGNSNLFIPSVDTFPWILLSYMATPLIEENTPSPQPSPRKSTFHSCEEFQDTLNTGVDPVCRQIPRSLRQVHLQQRVCRVQGTGERKAPHGTVSCEGLNIHTDNGQTVYKNGILLSSLQPPAQEESHYLC